jgi:hypothetical protein
MDDPVAEIAADKARNKLMDDPVAEIAADKARNKLMDDPVAEIALDKAKHKQMAGSSSDPAAEIAAEKANAKAADVLSLFGKKAPAPPQGALARRGVGGLTALRSPSLIAAEEKDGLTVRSVLDSIRRRSVGGGPPRRASLDRRRSSVGESGAMAADALRKARDLAQREEDSTGYAVSSEEIAALARENLENQMARKRKSALSLFRRAKAGGSKKSMWRAAKDLSLQTKVKKRGPRTPCGMCSKWFFNSVPIWTYGPWCVIFCLFMIFNFGVIMMGALVFADCPDVIVTWGMTVLQGLCQSWMFFDPLVIITRNNMKSFKKRIRSKRYQLMEKAIMSPITAFLKFMGRAFSPG